MNSDWNLAQAVRQMNADEVVDLVVRQNGTIEALGDELDQMRIRAEMAEDERDTFRRHLAEAESELRTVEEQLAGMLERRTA